MTPKHIRTNGLESCESLKINWIAKEPISGELAYPRIPAPAKTVTTGKTESRQVSLGGLAGTAFKLMNKVDFAGKNAPLR